MIHDDYDECIFLRLAFLLLPVFNLSTVTNKWDHWTRQMMIMTHDQVMMAWTPD